MKLINSKFYIFLGLIIAFLTPVIQLPSYAVDNKIEISVTTIEAKTILGIHDTVMDMNKIVELITKDYNDIGKFMEKNQIQWAGLPMTITISMSDKKWDFIAAIPIDKKDVKTEGRIQLSTIKAGKVVKGIMIGPYDNATSCYDKIVKFIRENNLKISGFSWEEYVSDPAETKPEDLITNIYFPVE